MGLISVPSSCSILYLQHTGSGHSTYHQVSYLQASAVPEQASQHDTKATEYARKHVLAKPS
jgi:hypothetical protein